MNKKKMIIKSGLLTLLLLIGLSGCSALDNLKPISMPSFDGGKSKNVETLNLTPDEIANMGALSKKETVTLSKCTDGDTFRVKEEKEPIRMILVDTPESVFKQQPFGKEASTFTCNALTNANTIEIAYDNNIPKKDANYGRQLRWVWVDGQLMQIKLMQNGLVSRTYVYNIKSDYEDTVMSHNTNINNIYQGSIVLKK